MLIYSPEQSRVIRRILFLTLFASLYGVYRGHYDLALVPGSIFFTSIGFWNNPIYDSWWRYADIALVRIGLTYQLYRASTAENGMEYYIATSIAVCSYLISCYMHSIHRTWIAIYLHATLHVFANIGNIMLYSGASSTESPHNDLLSN